MAEMFKFGNMKKKLDFMPAIRYQGDEELKNIKGLTIGT